MIKKIFKFLKNRFLILIFLFFSFAFFWFGTDIFIVHVSANDNVRELLYSNSMSFNHGLNNHLCCVLFSPDDDIESVLIGLIESEQEAIYGAQYLISSRPIAQALIDAHERGVHVQIVTDKFCSRSIVGKAKMLHAAGVSVFEYDPHKKTTRFFKKESIMHHKFFIFKKTIDDKSILASGSYNCTKAAAVENQENCIFIEDPSLIGSFTYQFERLKKRCGVFQV